eukprot:CAMPEP_0184854854 /NCGR_PEP_ID=MMETSP0580-20130426/232_1 /TAXON_ID=1118495 /ORGANISM="Dactyliosolen fragilissimus" /LENGTH=1327 /DNA_ID=CAMNT_0027349207 /DNA_START=50 /DNA_END=4033 /DNA_ORIENTATION=+
MQSEILEALLCPDGNIRSLAEAKYEETPLTSRVLWLMSLVTGRSESDSDDSKIYFLNLSNAGARMCCVLLRREVRTVGGCVRNSTVEEVSESIDMLRSILGPLLDAWQEPNVSSQDSGVTRLIGHVIAEVCSSLSLLELISEASQKINGNGSSCAVEAVLQVLATLAKDITTQVEPLRIQLLYLLSTLAQRCPSALWHAHILSNNGVFHIIHMYSISFSNDSDSRKCLLLVSIFDVICQVAIASQIAIQQEKEQPHGSSNKNAYLQAIKMQNNFLNSKPLYELNIDANSPATNIGKEYLGPILPVLMTEFNNVINNQLQNDASYEQIRSFLECVSHTATTSPSLFGGDSATFCQLVNLILCLAKSCESNLSCDNPLNVIALAALEAMSSFLQIPCLREIILNSPLVFSACLHGDPNNNISSIISCCAQLVVYGVDEDFSEWENEPATLQDDPLWWEGDETSSHASSLLETFLKQLGGGLQTFPLILPIVERLLVSKSNNSWREERGALALLSNCITAVPVAFTQYVNVALQAAIQKCQNTCVRVSFEAVDLLAKISSSYHDIRQNHASHILEAVSSLISSRCTRVSAHASLAIISFCQGELEEDSLNGNESENQCSLLPSLNALLNSFINGPISDSFLEICKGSDSHVPDAATGNIAVTTHAVSAVACLATITQSAFEPYYSYIVPKLLVCAGIGLNIDQSGKINQFHIPIADTSIARHEIVTLRGAAVEAVSIIGQAINSEEMFRPDAEKIISIALPILHHCSHTNDDSIIPINKILAALARTATTMETDYLPYVPSVLPHILKRLDENADVSFQDGNEDDLEGINQGESNYDEDTGIETFTLALPGMGVKKLVLNTTQIQEKTMAARALYEHANALGSSFAPYAEQCIKSLCPLIVFPYSSEVRTTAAQALVPIFNAASNYSLEQGSKSFRQTLPGTAFLSIVSSLAKQMKEEDGSDAEALFILADCASEICYSSFKHVKEVEDQLFSTDLNCIETETFVSYLISSVNACLMRRDSILKKLDPDLFNTDEDQKSELERVLEMEQNILGELVNSIGYTLKMMRYEFISIFKKIVQPAFCKFLLEKECDVRARVASVCLYDDFIEYCGPTAASEFSPELLMGIYHYVGEKFDEDNADLKRASVYGFFQIARNAPQCLMSHSSIEVLVKYLLEIARIGANASKKEEIDDVCLVEYSTSALATLFLFDTQSISQMKNVDLLEVLQIFLANLPIVEDEDVAQFCHLNLCKLIEGGRINLTQDASILLRVFGEIAAAVVEGEQIANPHTCVLIANFLKEMQKQVPDHVMKETFSSMPPSSQSGIQSLISTY